MHLTLHVTSRCNLQCRYCFSAQGSEDMSLETAQAALAIACAETQKTAPSESIGVVFYGGEPLLCKKLIRDLVRYCQDLRKTTGQAFHFRMTTNGTLLQRDFLEDEELKCVYVALSHDGVREAQDACRVDAAGQGTFDRLAPLLPRLLRSRPYAPVLMVVRPETVAWFADSVEYLFSQGFRYLLATLDYGAAWGSTALRVLEEQYARLATWYDNATRAEEKFFFSPFEVKIASHVQPEGILQERCDLATRQISVAPEGTLYPCVQFAARGLREWSLGSVERGIDEAQRKRLAGYRSREEKECQKCALRLRCQHHCGCVNYQTTGCLDRVSPIVCAHERLLIPLVDELAERLYRRRDPLFIQKHYNEFYPLVSAAEDLRLRPLRVGSKLVWR